MELADRPDLAPARDRGQRQQRAEQRSEGGWVGWEVRTWDVGFGTSQACCFRVYHKINGIGKSICQNMWFPSSFFFFSPLACRSRVGAVSEKWKKKERHSPDRTPESGESYPFWCLTYVRHRHDAKNGVFVQPRLGLCCSCIRDQLGLQKLYGREERL